ncbi:ArsR/SmtB family transcription factor [Actinophytocola gossypii]|uniref:Helix-turn-helix transcriptional regulator n=1 Tax=Actinophytocola gossypii TaxID=2812003 RepID=A0ABT2JG57_9PSEU|nr:helix-turn-helix domain-containing protein [Actinophytocola gossypii]MCT2586844.1 helix-turn-helix transcriptional regulator [Actinophytocola gossypii]
MENRTPRITDPKALRALAHPLRWQLLEIVDRAGTATATQCARETGESVANCSYHLNLLAKYHYVEQAEGAHGREKPWRAVNASISVEAEGMDADGALAARAATGAFLDYELNQIRERHQTLHLEPAEWRTAVGVDNAHEFLTAEEVEELRAEVRVLLDRFRDRKTNPDLRPADARSVTMFFSTTVAPQPD